MNKGLMEFNITYHNIRLPIIKDKCKKCEDNNIELPSKFKTRKDRIKKQIDTLDDVYVRNSLRKCKLPKTDEWIELKRQHIKLKRLINEHIKGCNSNINTGK